MENSTEDLSATVNHSFSGAGAGAGNASEESGWTSYIDYFMETQRRQEDASGAAPSTEDDVGSCSSTSHYGSDCEIGGSSWLLPALIEPSEASPRKLIFKRESRRKKAMYDESLEDTATSHISSPKKTDAAAELAGYNNLSNNGTNTRTDMVDDDDSTYI